MFGAIVDLNHQPTYVHWHFIDLSLPNVIVIVLMIVLFLVALFAPFPGSHRRRRQDGD